MHSPAIDDSKSSLKLAEDHQAPDTQIDKHLSKQEPTKSPSSPGRSKRSSMSLEESNLLEGFPTATGGNAAPSSSHQAQPQSSVASLVAMSQQSGHLAPVHTPRSKKGDSVVSHEEPFVKEPLTATAFPNGYHFPPKHTFAHSTRLGAIAFWEYVTTPMGFIVTIYGLNIVAWGGMLFLLLCNASPAMCYPTCNDINSPRRKWIEWDSQILNALFCVTGFGLAPWRFRDLYYLLQYRIGKKQLGLRRLAGIHRDWFRLAGSETLPPDLGPLNIHTRGSLDTASKLPFPEERMPDAPLTGIRAPPSQIWKLDLVIWFMVWNTFFQCCLAGFMWGMNRHNRPSWSTGLFVALACIVAGIGGCVMFLEGKNIKSIEGVEVSKEDQERLTVDREQGIWHYNNIKDKDLSSNKSHRDDMK